MWCHTWLYTKSHKETKNFYKQITDGVIELLDTLKKDGFSDDPYHPKNAYQMVKDESDIYLPLLSNVNNDKELLEIIEKYGLEWFIYERGDEPRLEIIDGVLYADFEGDHDVFRYREDYPDDKLYSYDDCIKFMNTHNCEVYKDTIDRLKRFWSNNPDWVIIFW